MTSTFLPGSDDHEMEYQGNKIYFLAKNKDQKIKKTILIRLKGDFVEETFTHYLVNKWGTIALLEAIPKCNLQPMLYKAVLTIIFIIDENGTKTYHHEPPDTHAHELFLKGAFVADPESENNMEMIPVASIPRSVCKSRVHAQ